MSKTYVVWRRHPDGYVAASVGRLPNGWTQPNDGTQITFEKLAEFTNWPDAAIYIASIKPA